MKEAVAGIQKSTSCDEISGRHSRQSTDSDGGSSRHSQSTHCVEGASQHSKRAPAMIDVPTGAHREQQLIMKAAAGAQESTICDELSGWHS